MGQGENIKQAIATAGIGDQTEILALVGRATGGDIDAFGDLYSIYLDPIYRYVFYHVKDKMTAEDITEEVFIKAWKAIDSCKGDPENRRRQRRDLQDARNRIRADSNAAIYHRLGVLGLRCEFEYKESIRRAYKRSHALLAANGVDNVHADFAARPEW